MATSSSGENDPLLEVAHTLPKDRKNTAPETRARFEYQDECVALTLLQHFGGHLRGVLVEYSTDMILLPAEGLPELVSIKHREPHHTKEPGWTWSALEKDHVLPDLYSAWKSSGKACTVAFQSNAGFSGSANILRQAKLNENGPATQGAVSQLRERLGVSEVEAREFLDCLNFPANPLPRRNEITDVGVRRTAELLKSEGRPATHAQGCYEALINRVSEASTDRPPSRLEGSSNIAATIRSCAENDDLERLKRGYLPAEEIRQLLLQKADQLEASTIPASSHPGWAPDPLFVGRTDYLDQLKELLQPGTPDPVAPVVVYGMTGTGKTSLVIQFAALNSESLRVEVIDGTSRASLLVGLERLNGQTVESQHPESVKGATLPENSATLLVIDGVTEPSVVRNLIPRRSLCRVLVTTTAGQIDESYRHIHLSSWSSAEAETFISQTLPQECPVDRVELAEELGNHPLAINQAVNYCLTVQITISQYLHRFRKKSAEVLDRGEARRHPVTVASAIKMAMTEAKRRNPLSRDLLALLSHMGAEPLHLSIFDERPVRPLVVGPVVRLREKRQRLRKRIRPEYSPGAFTEDDTGSNARVALNDEVRRDDAVACLSALSLIKLDQGSVTVHPLIRLFAADAAGESATWVETAFGLFTSQIVEGEDGSPRAPDALDTHISHILRLVDEALTNGMHGPAVMGVSKSLTDRLCALGDEETAVRIGEQLLPIAADLSRQGLAPLSLLFGVQESLGQAYVQSGDAERALELFRRNVELTEEYTEQESIDRAYLALGSAVAKLGHRDLAQTLLPKIKNPLSTVEMGDEEAGGRLLLGAHVRVRLLELTGNLDEALEINKWCLSRIESTPDVHPDLIMGIHSDTAMLARVMGETEWQEKYIAEVAETQVSRKGPRNDRFYLEIQIAAADAAIESENLVQASRVLTALEQAISTQFGVQSSLYASMQAVKGRLYLHRAANGEGPVSEAKAELLAAVERLRTSSGPERARLASALINLASAFGLEHDGEEAHRAAREAYEEDVRRFGMNHPETQFDLRMLHLIELQFDLSGYDSSSEVSESD